jgi:hypothetical protein
MGKIKKMEKTMQIMTQKKNLNKEISAEDRIKDSKLKETVLFLSSKKIINLNKINFNNEFEKNLKQEIAESINSKYDDINNKTSDLRKNGKDTGVLNFKLMMIPLKIKVFLSTYEKKDAENVLRRIQEIENEIGKFKK